MLGVIPNARAVRELRNKRSWTQEELSCQSLLSLRVIQKVESGRSTVSDDTMEALAQTFNVPVADLVDIWNVDLGPAISSDAAGRADEAERIATTLMERLPEGSIKHLMLSVRLATFLDHQGRLHEALSLLDRALQLFEPERVRGRDPSEDEYCRQYWLTRYQAGVVMRRIGEGLCARTFGQVNAEASAWLEKACDELDLVSQQAWDELRIAATHHLGVIHQIEGDYDKALDTFSKCLSDRGGRRCDGRAGFREAYEHRRLGQVHALMGAAEDAAREFERAREISEEHQHHRLIEEIREDAKLFRF